MMCEDNTSLFVRPSVHRCVLTSISGDLSCQSVIVFVVCTEFFGLRHRMWFWPSVLSGLFCVSCRRSAAACLSFAEPCHSRYYLRILLNWNLCRAIYVFCDMSSRSPPPPSSESSFFRIGFQIEEPTKHAKNTFIYCSYFEVFYFVFIPPMRSYNRILWPDIQIP